MDHGSLQSRLWTFFDEYAAFFEETASLEQEKLEALLSNTLSRIEHAIARQQAIGKRLENLERKRIALQKAAGMENLTFNEILLAAPAEERQRLKRLFDRTQCAISNIRYINEKSNAFAKTQLQRIHAEKGEVQSCGYSREQKGLGLRSAAILETKV